MLEVKINLKHSINSQCKVLTIIQKKMTDIVEHNIKMAISYRDGEAIDILRKQLTVPQST